jgi:hypothetical protein
MLYKADGGREWGFYVSSQAGVRPATTYGDTITPGNNVMGTAVEVLTAGEVATDLHYLLINLNGGLVAATAKDTLVDVLVDPAGGTNYSVLIQELQASSSNSFLNNFGGNGYWYEFPLLVTAGSSVAVRASVNNATVGTLKAYIQGWGRPRDARAARFGTFCKTFGTVLASSTGTAVTPGTTTEGAWTQLGTTADELWAWQLGCGINNAVMATNGYVADLGIGAAQDVAMSDVLFCTHNGEGASLGRQGPGFFAVPSGVDIFGRLQCSGVVDTGVSMALYGVGG